MWKAWRRAEVCGKLGSNSRGGLGEMPGWEVN